MKLKIILALFFVIQFTTFYSQNLPIVGFGDAANYSIDVYPVTGSSGLDLHWHGGIRFGDWTSRSVMQIANGNIGIGTNAPQAKLHINNGDNSYGAILANATEAPFSLYSKTIGTAPINSESFRLGLKYTNDENNGYISFYRGSGTFGGFLGFSTYGIERIRISSSGDVGIGTNDPKSRLHINGGDIIINNNGIGIMRGDNYNYGSGGAFKFSSSNNVSEQYIQLGRALSGSGTFFPHLTVMSNSGNIGIGITNPSNKLDVSGTIHSKEVKVDMIGWSDFVFKKEYSLPTLDEVEKHIKEKGHLKNIPSEEEVLKNGINLGEMNAKLLQKIEEMTLYMIDQNKKIKELENKLEKLKI